MSEWSDEACEAANRARIEYYIKHGNDASPISAFRAALTAADAVRKREAGEKRDNDAVWSHLNGVVMQLATLERRLTALETARQPEPPKPEPLKPATERRWVSMVPVSIGDAELLGETSDGRRWLVCFSDGIQFDEIPLPKEARNE